MKTRSDRQIMYGVLRFRSPDDDKDTGDDTDVESKDGDEKQAAGKGKDEKNDPGYVAMRQTQSLSKLVKKLTGEVKSLQKQISTKNTDSTIEEESDEPESSEATEPHQSKGEKARLSNMEKELAKLNKKLEQSTQEVAKRDQALKLTERRHRLESKLTELGAVKPAQARSIIEADHLIESEDGSEVVKVKLDSGDEDLVPVNDWLPTFKEENPHLFATAAKSGSGAGAGGAEGVKPKLATPEKLADPRKGGMDFADYEKNREKIHAELEREVTGIGK